MINTTRKQEILLRLKELETEKENLTQELENLKKTEICQNISSDKMAPDEKIKLFRSLFKGRDDVYARRWENSKTNKSGYSPAKTHLIY